MTTKERASSAVIGIFKDIADARQVVDELHTHGFGPHINLIENDQSGYQKEEQIETSEQRGGVGEFFSKLFGLDQDETRPGVSFQSDKKTDTDELDLAGSLGLDAVSERHLTEAYHQGHHLKFSSTS